MLHKKFNKDLATYFFMQKIDLCEIDFYLLKYLKNFKAMHKNNP